MMIFYDYCSSYLLLLKFTTPFTEYRENIIVFPYIITDLTFWKGIDNQLIESKVSLIFPKLGKSPAFSNTSAYRTF